MEKGFDTGKGFKKPNGLPRPSTLLVGVVFVLAVVLVSLAVSGSWYIYSRPQIKHAEDFDIQLSNDSSMTEHIVVYEDQGFEFITVKQQQTGFVTSIASLDHKTDTITVFMSAANKCGVVKDKFDGIEEDLEYLRSHNAQRFDIADEKRTYVIGERVETMDDVLIQMTPHCTLRNTYMLQKADQGRFKRGGQFQMDFSLGMVARDKFIFETPGLRFGIKWD